MSLLLLALLRPAAAFELWGTGPLANSSVQVSDDFELRYHHVQLKLPGFEDRNIHDYFEQVNRMNLLLNKDGLSVGAQVDEVALFSNRYILDGQLYHSWPLYDPSIVSPFPDALVTLEKLYLQRRWSHVELTVGDSYASFGRGIALNIVKNTDIDIDSSIRGARAKLHTGNLEITAVSGLTNSQLISQDYPNLDISRDPAHMVSGVRLEDYGVGPAHVGVHGVVYRFGRQEDEDRPGMLRYQEDLDAVVSGLTLELPSVLGVDWYAEGDLFGYRSPELSGTDGHSTGYAAYGSASAYPGKAVVLVEGKATRDTERINTFVYPEGWEVSSVPTLEYERVITEDSSAAVNSNDLIGGRVRVDYAVKPATFVPYVSLAAFRDEDVESGLHFNTTPETIGHGLAGLQWFHGDTLVQVNTGYRRDQRDSAAEGADSMVHLDSEFHFAVLGTESIELALSGKRFWWGENPQQQSDYLELENVLAWHRGEKLIFMLYQDYSDNPLIRSEGNISDKVYGAAEVAWQRTPASTVRVFYGAYKAGIRCSGGQCRSLPGFRGARLAWQSTF